MLIFNLSTLERSSRKNWLQMQFRRMHDFYFDFRRILHLALCSAIITVSIYFTRGFLAAETYTKRETDQSDVCAQIIHYFHDPVFIFSAFVWWKAHKKPTRENSLKKCFTCNMIWRELCYFELSDDAFCGVLIFTE